MNYIVMSGLTTHHGHVCSDSDSRGEQSMTGDEEDDSAASEGSDSAHSRGEEDEENSGGSSDERPEAGAAGTAAER